jgi:hypothetical protein
MLYLLSYGHHEGRECNDPRSICKHYAQPGREQGAQPLGVTTTRPAPA